jgi:transcriptional regulator with XRE-family HTH domain
VADQSGSVAELLRDLRERRGVSLRAAARGVGVDPGHLARVESGEKPVSGGLSEKLSSYYDVDPDAVHLAAGRIPPDVVALLIEHPEELRLLRERLGSRG